nr:PREDICTED: L-type lectin-domain containing receptor kinase IX.1-like [Musa acuminata subsp. malaccensis]
MVVGRSSSMLSPLFCLWIVVPSATCLSFNLSFLDPASRSGIELQGNATWNSTDGIQLTNDTIVYNVGRAVYREPLLLWDARTKAMSDFTTHFSFIIRNPSNTSLSGDGLAFFMAPYPSPLLPDSSGGLLGIFPRVSLNSLVPTVAVEFDTFQNEWDVDDHHVGIDVNSIVSQKVASWNGSLKTGRLANAWVSYDAITHNLSVFLTYADNPVISGDSVLHYIIDLRDHLPANVTVGFSAATGQVTETHAVVSWSFSSSLQPRSIPPPTAPTASDAAKSKSKTGLIVGLVIGAGVLMVTPGLLLFVLWRRRRKSRRRNAADGDEDMDFDQTTDDDFMGNRGPKRFAYKELARATRNFSDEGKLGEGGFGSVYRGHLKDLKLDVAIKRVSRESRQGRKEYVSEVKIISRLRHRNLVLNGDFDETQMECLMVVGLWCAHPDYNVRPSIRQAINALNLETPLPELPPKMPVPMYYTPWSDVSQSLHASSLATTTSITAKSAPTGSSSMSPSSSHLLKSPNTGAVIST